MSRYLEKLDGRVFRRVALWLGVPLAITVLAWQALWFNPAPGVDSSWGAGLELGLHRGVSFGSQLTFTYGPFGFLSITQLWYSGLAAISFAYAVVVRLALAAALFWSARRPFGSVGAFVLAVLVASIADSGAPELVLAVILGVWALTADLAPRWQALVSGAAGALAAIQLLHKVSVGVQLAVMALVLVLSLRGSRWRNAAAAAIAFILTLLICWLALGQGIGALPDYVVRSAQITLGYTSAMSLGSAAASWTYTAAFLALAIGIWGALHVTEARPRRERYGVLAMWVVFWFFTFKEGFVRQDSGHLGLFFSVMLGALFAFRWRRGGRWAGLLAICTLTVFTLAVQERSLTDLVDPTRDVSDAVNDLRVITSPGKTALIMERGRDAIRAADPLDPASAQLLAGRPVAVFPSELAYAWAYRLDWDPFPVLQAYSAYTSSLDRMDADFLTSARAPQRILVIGGPEIDGRLVWFDAPQTSRTMLCHYRPLRLASGTMVLALVDNRCAPPAPLATVHADWGQPVPVPAPPTPRSLVFVRIAGVGVSGFESLESLFYKPAQRYVIINGGASARLVEATAGDGLPVRAAAGVDFPQPFNIAPQASTIAVTKDGQGPTGGTPITYSFYAETVAP